MPAVDILPCSPSAGVERAETAANNCSPQPSGDDFANAMKKALAPKEKASPDKSTVRSADAGLARESKVPLLTTREISAEVPIETSAKVVTESQSESATKDPKPFVTAQEEKPSASLDGLLSIIDVPVTPPVFFSIPLTGQFSPPPTASVSSSQNNSAVTALAGSSKPAPAQALPDADPVVSENLTDVSPQASPTAVTPVAHESGLAQTLAAEPGEKNSLPTTPLTAPKETNPGSFILPPALFSPLAETAAMPVISEIPAEVATVALNEMAISATAELPSKDAGTGVATTGSVMKKADKTNKVAGLDVQILPVAGQESPRDTVLMPRLVVAAVRAAENRSQDFNPTFAGGETAQPLAATAAAATFTPVELPSLTDARLKSMERTHDMVSLHAMRLVESKSDVLSVVIKPAVGTELTLELRQREGGVEALAVLSRGDYQFLNQHWPELQQRLEQRGIKLAPLGGEANFSQNNNQQQQRSARDEAAMESAAAFAEFAAVGGATARRAMSLNGWESWA